MCVCDNYDIYYFSLGPFRLYIPYIYSIWNASSLYIPCLPGSPNKMYIQAQTHTHIHTERTAISSGREITMVSACLYAQYMQKHPIHSNTRLAYRTKWYMCLYTFALSFNYPSMESKVFASKDEWLCHSYTAFYTEHTRHY